MIPALLRLTPKILIILIFNKDHSYIDNNKNNQKISLWLFDDNKIEMARKPGKI